jgi:hypothetical protein
MKIGILGAGPAGIFAALKIRNVTMNDVYLIDANPGIGRKLSITGSGRCNITNLNITSDAYFSFQPADLSGVISHYSPVEIRKYLEEIGIPTTATDDGWVYPLSFSAGNVLQILHSNLLFSGVNLIENTKVLSVQRKNNQFQITVDNDKALFCCDRLIVATGGKAYPQLRADTSILTSFQDMGIHLIPFRPALVPIELTEKLFGSITGVRMDAGIRLYDKTNLIQSSEGNIIFTEFGLNGPGVMNLSHLIAPESEQNQSLQIDFLPGSHQEMLETLFYKRKNSLFVYRSIFLSILPDKVVDFFFGRWGLSKEMVCSAIEFKTFRKHINDMRTVNAKIRGTKGYKFSQAAAGGIPLSEIRLESMESMKIPGLFFAGEVLDVIGPCGGYNLHWAISSGLIAGESASRQD